MMYKTRWKLTLLLLIVATLFYIQKECYVVYTGQRNSEIIKLIIGKKVIFTQMLCGSLGLC